MYTPVKLLLVINAVLSSQVSVVITWLVNPVHDGEYVIVGVSCTTKAFVNVVAPVFPYGVLTVTIRSYVPVLRGVVMLVPESVHL